MIPAKKINEVVGIVATQVRVARELGSETIRAVATAAIREAANQDDLIGAIAERTGLDVADVYKRQEVHVLGKCCVLGVVNEQIAKQ